MAKDKLTEYDATANNNTVVGDVNLAENSMNPSDVNNALREIMSHQKEAFGSGTPLYVDQTNNRVGIKTTAMSSYYAKDLVLSADNQGGITIVGGTSDTGQYLAFADGTSGSDRFRGYLQYAHDTNNMILATDGSERIRINSSGNVGINSSNPSAKLTVEGTLSVRTSSSQAFNDSNNANNLTMTDSKSHFNLDGADKDFQVSSDNNANMLFVDGGNNIVGIGRVPATNDGGAGSLQLEGNDGIALRRNGQTNSFIIRPLSSGDGIRFTQGGTGDRVTIGSSGDLLATATIGGAGSYSNTTSGGANVHILSSGVLVRSTSSLQYKNTVNDATHGLTELLTLRPVTYKGNNDGDNIFGGLIAEEVHDAGLTEFVQYNEDNEPDALAYGNMVSLCIKAIQELKAENTALANRITTLEGA